MAYQKQTWEDFPSANTLITANRLNHIEDGIADVETGLTPVTSYTEANNKSYACNYINDNIENLQETILDIFSTSEVKTNKIWVDNKPIYRKCYSVSSFPNNGNVLLDANVSNIDTVISMGGYETTSTEYFSIPSAYSTSYFDSLVYEKNTNKIRVHTTSNRTNCSGYVWIEYTKTTD